jgi:hypothetical protein
VEKVLGRKLLKPKQDQQAAPQHPVMQPKQAELKPMTAESAADFFNQLGSKATTGNNNAAEEQKEREEEPIQKEAKMTFVTETVSRNSNWDEGVEGLIKRNLLIGNLEYAAEIALKAGRTAEALLIADAGGEQLFEKIKEEYFSNVCKDQYVKVIVKSIVQEDFKELLTSSSLLKNSNWRETLAYILSYVEDDRELNTLVQELGDELLNKKKDINSAISCYMIAQNLETVVDLWKKRALFFMKKGMDRNESLFQLFEKCILFRAVTKTNAKLLVDLDLIVSDASEFLVAEDMRALAYKYLELIGNPKQPNVAFAKDRVFNSDSTRMLAKQFARPSVPYQVEKIKVQMSQYTRAVTGASQRNNNQ